MSEYILLYGILYITVACYGALTQCPRLWEKVVSEKPELADTKFGYFGILLGFVLTILVIGPILTPLALRYVIGTKS